MIAASCSKNKDNDCRRIAIVKENTYTREITREVQHDEVCGEGLVNARNYSARTEFKVDGQTYYINEWVEIL